VESCNWVYSDKVTTVHKYLFGLVFFILPSIAYAKPSLCDRAMDSVYIASGIGGGYHRHFDGGHTILGAFSACDKVLRDKHLIARIVEVGKSLYRDFKTPRGVPLVTLNQQRVNGWRPMLSQIGLSTRTIYELNSFTPLKAFYTVLTAVVIAYDWDVQDVERYTEFVLATTVLNAVWMNPVGMVVSMIGVVNLYVKVPTEALFAHIAPAIKGLVVGAITAGVGVLLPHTVIGAMATLAVAVTVSHIYEIISEWIHKTLEDGGVLSSSYESAKEWVTKQSRRN